MSLRGGEPPRKNLNSKCGEALQSPVALVPVRADLVIRRHSAPSLRSCDDGTFCKVCGSSRRRLVPFQAGLRTDSLLSNSRDGLEKGLASPRQAKEVAKRKVELQALLCVVDSPERGISRIDQCL